MIEILFENEDFLACIKPVGVPSQCDGAEDAVKLLKEQTGDEIYPVHRLDTAVGGTMIFAKNKKTAAYLSKEIAEKRFAKAYFAVTEGVPEEKEGRLEDLLFKDKQKNKSYVVKRERKGVRRASLDYRVLDEADGKALVCVMLNTGRSHQIRVQFASRKMPLAGTEAAITAVRSLYGRIRLSLNLTVNPFRSKAYRISANIRGICLKYGENTAVKW